MSVPYRPLPRRPFAGVLLFCRRLLRRACLAVALLLHAALATAAEPLTLAVSESALSLPLWVAESQGYFAAEGVAVRSQTCIGGQRCIRRLFDGTAQLATASDLPVMFNAFERADYAVIGTFVSSARDLKLVVRKSAGIGSVQQLQGKRVGTVKGASVQYLLDITLLFHDVDPDRVTVVMLAPEQLGPALQRGEVDAVTLWEPWAFRAVRALGADAAVLPSLGLYTQTFNLVVDRRTLAEREPELVKVLRAIERAQRYIVTQPKQAQLILRERLQLDDAFVDWVWGDLDYRLGLDQSLLSTLDAEARWALREGHVAADRRMPNFLMFIDPGPLRKAAPAAVTLVH